MPTTKGKNVDSPKADATKTAKSEDKNSKGSAKDSKSSSKKK